MHRELLQDTPDGESYSLDLLCRPLSVSILVGGWVELGPKNASFLFSSEQAVTHAVAMNQIYRPVLLLSCSVAEQIIYRCRRVWLFPLVGVTRRIGIDAIATNPVTYNSVENAPLCDRKYEENYAHCLK